MENLEKFKNLGEILSKTQQKKILGGYNPGGGGGGCIHELTCDTTGCLPSFATPSDTCVGNDGCTYNAAHSC